MTRLLFSSFSAEEQQRALDRFKMIQPFLEEGIFLSDIAPRHGISLRTVRRWAKAYRQHGLAGLCRKPRGDKGNHRRLCPTMKVLIRSVCTPTAEAFRKGG